VPELLDFVERVRRVSGLPTGFKAVIGAYGWLDALCREVTRRGPEAAPDFITVDSADGGTGAAPMSLMDNVGLPIEESLPMVCDILERHGLKGRVRVVASGKLLLPSAVAWALCAGADFVNIGRGFMFSIGCIQAMRCNRNTCPTGVTTHDPRRQAALDPADKSVKAATYCINLRREVETIAHACGVREPRDLRRYHLRLIRQGRPVPMDELHPYPDVPARDPTGARAT
jgi:glutamate synthase domain-containing protein 2